MNKFFAAIALTIAMPSIATAHGAKPSGHSHMMSCKSTAGLMAGMTKQEHQKMLMSCGKSAQKVASTRSAVKPPHKI